MDELYVLNLQKIKYFYKYNFLSVKNLILKDSTSLILFILYLMIIFIYNL